MTQKAGSEAVRIERPDEAPRVCQDAFNSGDLDGLLSPFEPEAVIFFRAQSDDCRAFAIREVFAGFLEAGWRWEIKLVSHHHIGDIALNTVEHALRKNSADGDADTLRLRAAVVFRQQKDGSWRFLIDNVAPFE